MEFKELESRLVDETERAALRAVDHPFISKCWTKLENETDLETKEDLRFLPATGSLTPAKSGSAAVRGLQPAEPRPTRSLHFCKE
ncbi:hypothetical protein SRHO_G00239160 [Serrasalmus rhombeus]